MAAARQSLLPSRLVPTRNLLCAYAVATRDRAIAGHCVAVATSQSNLKLITVYT